MRDRRRCNSRGISPQPPATIGPLANERAVSSDVTLWRCTFWSVKFASVSPYSIVKHALSSSIMTLLWHLSLHWKRMCAAALREEWTKTATTTFIETLQQHPCIWRVKRNNTKTYWHWNVRTDYRLWNRAEKVNCAHSEFRREASRREEVLWNRGLTQTKQWPYYLMLLEFYTVLDNYDLSWHLYSPQIQYRILIKKNKIILSDTLINSNS